MYGILTYNAVVSEVNEGKYAIFGGFVNELLDLSALFWAGKTPPMANDVQEGYESARLHHEAWCRRDWLDWTIRLSLLLESNTEPIQ